MNKHASVLTFSSQDKSLLADANIDYELTQTLLDTLRHQRTASAHDNDTPERLEIPEIDNRQIIDCREAITLRTHYQRAIAQLAKYIPYDTLQSDIVPMVQRHTDGHTVRWDNKLLERVGRALYPVCAYGLLNGGSATSYIDQLHNHRFSPPLFQQWKERFDDAHAKYAHLPKALCPALYNYDGTAGPTFMELHARHVTRASAACATPIPLFQMTNSVSNADITRATQAAFGRHYPAAPKRASAHYMDAAEERMLCVAQPLVATFAYRTGDTEFPMDATPALFRERASTLPYGLPGGHGQCFHALRAILEGLLDNGTRFIFLGNVDNLGYTINPIGLAYLALEGGVGGFEAVPRSAVDIKGGVFVRTREGRMRNTELGGGVTMDEVAQSEAAGKTVLFNCAVGLFDLERLLLRLDEYLRLLPVHCMHKKTARGEYWQLEQLAWDIVECIDDPYIFVSNKTERFLSAKLIIESFILSGLPAKMPPHLSDIATRLHNATQDSMAREYGVLYKEGAWWQESI